ncbi:MAG: hypothetical protein FD181_2629 [Prolixibacteraceae bacterium]|nr:MAG: hypothetical protein FD181_2629 [Prolixibacteraceae bacterium]
MKQESELNSINSYISYFEGIELYGDNFNLKEITQWFEEEAEAYADLVNKNNSIYTYPYHNSNILNGYNHLKKVQQFNNALGIGSAYGMEFLPIIDRIRRITILEPSENLRSDKIGSIIPNYLKPNINGLISCDESSCLFDLITCFGVLHHIPNVTTVLNELIRVLMPGGYLLIKEPISTMGDWRKPRQGLTKNERGIPVKFFDNIFQEAKVEVVKKTYIDSLFMYKILFKLFNIGYKSKSYAKFDKLISQIFSWNMHYHRTSNYQKIAPGGVFYVIRKLPK